MITPRGELHIHLEGSVRPQVLLDIARRNDRPLPVDTVEELGALYEFTDFEHFIEVWHLTTNCLQTAEDFQQITLDYAAQAASHGARYVEAIFSPAERVMRGVPFEDLFEGYCAGAQQALDAHGVLMRLTPDIFWSIEPDLAEETARWAVRYSDRGIVGFGIGGNEHWQQPATYARAFAIAREGGLASVPHAGEVTGPARVAEVLDHLKPDRIRHGIGAAGDPALLARLADEGIGLDVCPTSNVRTGAVDHTDDVPLDALLDAGVAFSINTDDPAMFNTDLGQEYALVNERGVSDEQLWANILAIAAMPREQIIEAVDVSD
ncbi:adenosine deaminase [Euzebya tangerina]|uniref:adenosine deaminase n=1 Tax=Euzebya tangerina TaxID=591198 RepID=UPI000E31A8F5|nr:adenosine deaminase [Euzebya tangerina]